MPKNALTWQDRPPCGTNRSTRRGVDECSDPGRVHLRRPPAGQPAGRAGRRGERPEPRAHAERAAGRACAASSPTAPTRRRCGPPWTAPEWDAVYDVSGFVMAAGGSAIGGLLDLLRRPRRRVRVRVLDHGLRAQRRHAVDRGPADLDRPDHHLRRIQGLRRGRGAEPARPHRFPGRDRPAGRDLRPGQQHPRHGDRDVAAAAPRPAGPGAARWSGHRELRPRRRSVRAAGRDGRPARPRRRRGGQRDRRGHHVGRLRARAGRHRRGRARPAADARPPARRAAGPLFGHLFRPGTTPCSRPRRPAATWACRWSGASTPATGRRYEWFLSSPLVDAPDVLADPVWKAGYDFPAEARAAARL